MFVDKGFSIRILPYATCMLGMVIFGLDSGIVGSIQASAQWQEFFGHPHGSTLGILNSISTLGTIVGNLASPYFNDRWGRKTGIYIGTVIICAATALQAGSTNVKMYLAARFFVGVGILFSDSSCVAYLAEFSTKKERPLLLGAYVPFYFVGSIVISWTCYSTVNWPNNWSWRVPSLVQLVPSLMQVVFVLFIPQSPRWLVTKGRNEEALEVLVKYHGSGEKSQMIMDDFAEMVIQTLEEERLEKGSQWKDLISSKGMKIRTFIAAFAGIASQWSGNNIISYYITTILNSVGITDPKTQTLINGMLNVWTFLFTVMMAFVSQKWGRRPIFITGLISMIAVWTIFTGLSAGYANTGNSGMGAGVLAMIFLFNAAYGSVWSTLFMYPVELFPSSIRTKGFAAQNSIDYLGLFLNIFANPVIMDAIAWKYYIVYIVILCIQLVVVYLTYVETNGCSVEEICAYFDGEPKWFAGPGSKKLLRDVAAEHREYASRELAKSQGVEVDNDSKEKFDGTVVTELKV